MTFNQFKDFVDHMIAKEIPPSLMNGLNMGVIILKDINEEDDSYIMGEYISDELGNYILLYYGSFKEALEDESIQVWEEEIIATIKHELLHHVEALANDEQLAKKEEFNTTIKGNSLHPLKQLINHLNNYFRGKRKN